MGITFKILSFLVAAHKKTYFSYVIEQGSSNWGSRDWEKNSEMQQEIEVKKTFFFDVEWMPLNVASNHFTKLTS